MHTRIAASLLILFAGLSTLAQEEKLKEFKGMIRQVDAKTGAITLKPLYDVTLREFNLASKDVPVTNALGQVLKVADLREELRVIVKLRDDEEIAAIRVDGPYHFGVIKSVNAANRTVSFKDVFGDRTVAIPVDVKIIIKGASGSLADCKVGEPIQMLLSLDKKTILQVQAGGATLSRDPYLRINRSAGIIVDLDRAKRKVQIMQQSLDYGIMKSYDLSSDAYLRLMYKLDPLKEVEFDQVAKWTKVSYCVDRDTGKVVNIDAELPFMSRRKVVKLEPMARKITVTEDGIEAVLDLDDAVTVRTPRGEGKLADVIADSIVNCALSLDRSKVLLLYLWDR